MRTILKYTAAVALTGALALASAAPSEARGGRNAALFGGLAAGAIIGAAAAGGGYYYGEPGYVYDSDYAYGPGYAYGPVYAEPYYPYGYAPAYRYRGWRGGKDLSIESQR